VQCVLTALEEDSAGLGDVTTLSTCAAAPSKPAQGAEGLVLQRATLTVWRVALLQAGARAGGCHSCELTAVRLQTRQEARSQQRGLTGCSAAWRQARARALPFWPRPTEWLLASRWWTRCVARDARGGVLCQCASCVLSLEGRSA